MSSEQHVVMQAFAGFYDGLPTTPGLSTDDYVRFPMLVDMSPPYDHSFGRVLRQRRDELGLSKAAVAERGGPHPTTMAQLEENKVERPRPSTFAAVDSALDWDRGTSARLFHTGRLPDDVRPSTPAVTGSHDGLLITESELTHLILWNTKLAHHSRGEGDRVMEQCAREITDVTNALIGRWIDRALDDDDQLTLGLLANVLAGQPMADPEHRDYTDQLYRRWRLGIIPDADLSPTVLQAFRARRAQ